MRRPYKVRNIRSSKVRSYATGEAAQYHVALFMYGPLAKLAVDFEWIEPDGTVYPLAPIVESMWTLARIWDISKPYAGESA